jgi:hypothetical protein
MNLVHALFFKIHFNIIIPSTPGFHKLSLQTKIPYEFLTSIMHATCLALLILLDMITLIIKNIWRRNTNTIIQQVEDQPSLV